MFSVERERQPRVCRQEYLNPSTAVHFGTGAQDPASGSYILLAVHTPPIPKRGVETEPGALPDVA